MVYALRFSSAMLRTRETGPLPAGSSAPSLSKRGVVAFRRRSLRSVESEYGRTPKGVLSGTFEKLRRTASTTSSKRMSLRFARTPQEDRTGGLWRDANVGSNDWDWRPIGDVAGDVVRNAIVAAALAKARQVPE